MGDIQLERMVKVLLCIAHIHKFTPTHTSTPTDTHTVHLPNLINI